MFYGGNKKAFFYPDLISALCKRAGVSLLDVDKVLPMDPPIHPLLVWTCSTSTGKRRRTRKASISRTAAGSDGEDPLTGARVEIDLDTIWRNMGSAYVDFTPVPPSTAL